MSISRVADLNSDLGPERPSQRQISYLGNSACSLQKTCHVIVSAVRQGECTIAPPSYNSLSPRCLLHLSPSPLLVSPPMFSNCSHVQITGGHFMTAAQDINFESGVQAARNLPDVLPALNSGPGQNSSRIAGGPERTERERVPRMLPYGASRPSRL